MGGGGGGGQSLAECSRSRRKTECSRGGADLRLAPWVCGGRRRDPGLRRLGSARQDFRLEFGNVETLVDDLWHRFDLRPQLLLHGKEVVAVVVGDEVDGEAEVSEAAGAADTMEIGLGGLGEVKVDDDVHRLDVDTSRQQV